MKRSGQVILFLVVAAVAIGIINHSLFGLNWWCRCIVSYPVVFEECETECQFRGSSCLSVDFYFFDCTCMSGECVCPYRYVCENGMHGYIYGRVLNCPDCLYD